MKEPKATIKIDYFGTEEDGAENFCTSAKGRVKDLIKAYMGITKLVEKKIGIPKNLIKEIVDFTLKGTHSKEGK